MRCAPGFGAILQHMRDFQKIIAWQKAHALGAISEGAGKPTRAEFLRYPDMAQGSVL
jgi:hypothetical protein